MLGVDALTLTNERLQHFKQATSETELLKTCIEGWGHYIPEIYGLAKALQNKYRFYLSVETNY